MIDLDSNHREFLRAVVTAVKEKRLEREFTVLFSTRGSSIGMHDNFPQISEMALQVLADGGFLTLRRELYMAVCYLKSEAFSAVESNFRPLSNTRYLKPPVEITESLNRFQSDYPDPTRVAFVIMQFSETEQHTAILAGIEAALQPHGLIAVRADEKEYHEDLYYNILTYIFGCQFGIAVFERIISDDFNPNVSLEVGYMTGIGKSVCFLKDETLKSLQTDLIGKLYRTFDAHNPKKSIPPKLIAWMDEKGFIVRR